MSSCALVIQVLVTATTLLSVYGQSSQSYYDPYIITYAPEGFKSIYERKIAYEYGGESDGFGKSVAVDGNVMLVGAPFSDTHGSQAGNAHIYTLDEGSEPTSTNGWVYVASLNANETYPYDFFGWDVDLANGVAVVGAWQRDDPLDNAGAVYVFQSNSFSGEWTSTAILRGQFENEYFGISVALNSEATNMLVGAAGHPDADGNTGGFGAVYVYKLGHDGVSWNPKSLLRAQDETSRYDYFGISVALNGKVGIIGAYGSNPGTGESAGSAYVINGDDDGKNWLVVQKLVPSDSSQNAFFGRAVAIHNETIAIGADGESTAGTSSGAVYIYRQGSNSGQWKQKQKIVPTKNVEGYELFGTSLALWDHTLVVGASGAIKNDVRAGSVSVYEYDADGKTWNSLTTLQASDASASDKYGTSVDIHKTTILVGSELADGFDYDSGSIYAYSEVPDYVHYADYSLSTAGLTMLTIGAFIFSGAIVIWVYKSGKLDSLIEKSFYFGSLRHSDFDVSRRGDFEMAAGDSTHSTSSQARLFNA